MWVDDKERCAMQEKKSRNPKLATVYPKYPIAKQGACAVERRKAEIRHSLGCNQNTPLLSKAPAPWKRRKPENPKKLYRSKSLFPPLHRTVLAEVVMSVSSS